MKRFLTSRERTTQSVVRQIRTNPHQKGRGERPSLTDLRDRLLTEREVAERLHVSVKTVQLWRYLRKNIAYLKIGKSIRYLPEDLDALLLARRIEVQGPRPGTDGSRIEKGVSG